MEPEDRPYSGSPVVAAYPAVSPPREMGPLSSTVAPSAAQLPDAYVDPNQGGLVGDITCPSDMDAWTSMDMYFGLTTPDGDTITEEDWDRFVQTVVTPRFNQGSTVIDAEGQWEDEVTGETISEPSKVLKVVMQNDDDLAGNLTKAREVADIYKAQFRQQAVLRMALPSCGGRIGGSGAFDSSVISIPPRSSRLARREMTAPASPLPPPPSERTIVVPPLSPVLTGSSPTFTLDEAPRSSVPGFSLPAQTSIAPDSGLERIREEADRYRDQQATEREADRSARALNAGMVSETGGLGMLPGGYAANRRGRGGAELRSCGR